MTLQDLITQAVANRKNGYYMSVADIETPAGKVRVVVDHSVGAAVRNNTTRTIFELNGRRIARADLAKKLEAI